MCVHRDSNPNLNLGRVEYYPCTMNAQMCTKTRLSKATIEYIKKKAIIGKYTSMIVKNFARKYIS